MAGYALNQADLGLPWAEGSPPRLRKPKLKPRRIRETVQILIDQQSDRTQHPVGFVQERDGQSSPIAFGAGEFQSRKRVECLVS